MLFCRNNQFHKISNSPASLIQFSSVLSINFAKLRNMKNDFSLLPHFHCIIAAITFTQSGASLLAEAIL